MAAKRDEQLTVIEKMHELLVWTSEHVAKFPRSHRFGLGVRLEENLSQIMELLLRAKFTRERAALLHEANILLEVARFQFRLAKDLRCLSLDSCGSGARFINDIGKLVGGWVKRETSAKNHHAPPRQSVE